MNITRTFIFAVAAIAIAGCATKRYPIATTLSPGEAELMTCDGLQLEILKAEQVEHQINETGEFDSKSALGILGDFGIGNGMAKSEARTALSARVGTIREAQARRGCLRARAERSDSPPADDTQVTEEDAAEPTSSGPQTPGRGVVLEVTTGP